MMIADITTIDASSKILEEIDTGVGVGILLGSSEVTAMDET